jgi:hypothetical protein
MSYQSIFHIIVQVSSFFSGQPKKKKKNLTLLHHMNEFLLILKKKWFAKTPRASDHGIFFSSNST